MSATIWVIALADAAFAVWFSASFGEWEMNPVARTLGVYPAIVLRILTVAVFFETIRPLSECRARAYTFLVFGVHVWLVYWYVAGILAF